MLFRSTATNYGELATGNVVLTNTLSPLVTYVSSSASTGTPSVAGNTITCNFGTLNVGSSASLTVQATAASPGLAYDVAVVTHSQVDGVPANNRVTNTVTVGSIISINTTLTNAFESTGTPGTVRFTRTGITTNDVTIYFSVTGSAIATAVANICVAKPVPAAAIAAMNAITTVDGRNRRG